MVAHKRAECYEVWRDAVAGDDFIGIQNYEQCVYDANGIVPAPQGAPVNDAGARLDPASLVHCAQYIHGLTGLPIFVTEHGIGTKNDERRCSFLEGSLACLASERGDVPVMGYLHWTLEDNFEWIFGYSNTFGLCSVDRTTLDRTPKPSADLYAKLVAGYRS
ncbi:family 1 glycosylhydrolase [Bifidobacterium pullorum subsp. saeculare]|uniref:Family 1 glycosylhydrolase n=1 Tax=Bifidobacterium pullorum subsp. saeculare TaxID=78257 RepID=A0A938WX62_9BIFI|nr:family 1 glycosylhydrolase [Bifidobacterium pullorum subsp. saeculare]